MRRVRSAKSKEKAVAKENRREAAARALEHETVLALQGMRSHSELDSRLRQTLKTSTQDAKRHREIKIALETKQTEDAVARNALEKRRAEIRERLCIDSLRQHARKKQLNAASDIGGDEKKQTGDTHTHTHTLKKKSTFTRFYSCLTHAHPRSIDFTFVDGYLLLFPFYFELLYRYESAGSTCKRTRGGRCCALHYAETT
jgi:hypothetical protein